MVRYRRSEPMPPTMSLGHDEHQQAQQLLSALRRQRLHLDQTLSSLEDLLAQSVRGTKELIQRGVQELQQGNYAEAIVDFNRVLQKYPEQKEALFYRAQAYVSLQAYSRALHDYNVLIEVADRTQQHCHHFYNNRGVVHHLRRDFTKAKRDYTEAIRLKPDYVMGWTNRGEVNLHTKDFDSAVEDCTHALLLDPTHLAALTHRGWAYHNLAETELAKRDAAKAAELGCSKLMKKLEKNS